MTARAQALVETALVIPLVIILCVAVLGLGQVSLSDIRLQAAVSEAARVAATANSASEAQSVGLARGTQVAADQRLPGLSLSIDTSAFRPGGHVRADGRVTVALIPAYGSPQITLHRSQVEPVDPMRNSR